MIIENSEIRYLHEWMQSQRFRNAWLRRGKICWRVHRACRLTKCKRRWERSSLRRPEPSD